MNAQSEDPKHDNTRDSVDPLIVAVKGDVAESQKTGTKTIKTANPQGEKQNHPQWSRKPDNIGSDRIIELVLASAIASFAYLGYISAKGSSQQTEELIKAAGISAYAAQQNAQASRNFADAARGINQGVSDAVGRLQAQATVTELARETSEAASGRALQATIDNFHQDQRAWMGFVSAVGEAKVGEPLSITVNLSNTGKTPATHVVLQARMQGMRVSQVPDFGTLKPVNSVAVIYPNGPLQGVIEPLRKDVITAPTVQPIRDGLATVYIFGRVDYQDVFRRPHWMTFCYFLLKDLKSYGICASGNDISEEHEGKR